MDRESARKTRFAFIATSLLSVPLLTGCNFVGVILYRDLGGTPFQLTILTMLRPLVSILALYWSFAVAGRSDRLLSNLVWSGVLARLPFFLCPFVKDPWFFIAIMAFYMMLSRGGIPAWMEIFRRNLPSAHHGKIYSSGAAWGYVEGAMIGIGMGMVFDNQPEAWRWLFPLAATIGLVGVATQWQIPIKFPWLPTTRPTGRASLWRLLVEPWKQSFLLLKKRPDFRNFQWGYMLCGGAIMAIHPVLPIFYVDVLGVSHTELATGIIICKGLGFALTSPLWARKWSSVDVYRFSAAIFLCVAFYPLLLMFAPFGSRWFYLGCLVYGVGQAGSEMCWHLSGSVFSQGKDSSPFTGVNVTMVGVRGAVIPALGSVLCSFGGPLLVFAMSTGVCCVSAWLMLRCSESGQFRRVEV